MRVSTDGLFLNADAGFDCKSFKSLCIKYGITLDVPGNTHKSSNLSDGDAFFGPMMYKERNAIERMNAWMDNNRTLLNRFDTTWLSWNGCRYLSAIASWAKLFVKV